MAKCTSFIDINCQDVQDAFLWVNEEMKEFGFEPKERINIINPEGYREDDNASVALFYDRTSDSALCRVNWRDGKIRYDIVENFHDLFLNARNFTDHLLRNGIKISNLYIGT